MTADAATIRISNQKSGVKGACVHHEAISGVGLSCLLKTFIFRVDVMSQFNVFDDSTDISIELLIVL